MTSATDSVTALSRLKDGDFFSAMAGSLKKLKCSKLFSLFIVCSNPSRSALVRELFSNNSLFVGQLYEDKSMALRTRDLIFFTTNLQTVNYSFHETSSDHQTIPTKIPSVR